MKVAAGELTLRLHKLLALGVTRYILLVRTLQAILYMVV